MFTGISLLKVCLLYRRVKDKGINEPPIILTDGVHADERLLELVVKNMREIAELVEAMKEAEKKA
jgi:hypothetical protein